MVDPPADDEIVLIDCHHAGISGDMLLGALIDLGADEKVVSGNIDDCTEDHGQVRMKVDRVSRASISCRKVDFEISGSGEEIDMESCIRKVNDSWIRDRGLEVIGTLRRAESTVHGTETRDHHHLHEVGRLDALADIVGCLSAWKDLGFDGKRVESTRVALGGGKVNFSHGDFPVPAPATLEILRGCPVTFGGDRELTTPTGAALLVNLVGSFVDDIDMVPTRTGWGAGQDSGEFLNATRIVVGKLNPEFGDTVDILETNIDDATPETLGYSTERLMSEGALDVSIMPSIMKKGRPGQLVRVICRPADTDRFCDMLLRETGSLGARIQRGVERRKSRREVEQVSIELGGVTHDVRVKVAFGQNGEIINAKPEYSDVLRICRETGIGFPEVHRKIMGKIGGQNQED
jgi:uncharacterized protein (TIGR00299 family) protein